MHPTVNSLSSGMNDEEIGIWAWLRWPPNSFSEVFAVDTSTNPFVEETTSPVVTCNPETGDFLVLWDVSFSIQDENVIWGNVVDNRTARASTVFEVGTEAINGGDFTAPAIATGNGHALAVWQFRPDPAEHQDLAGRLIDLPFFSDGFETGDVTGWSSSTP